MSARRPQYLIGTRIWPGLLLTIVVFTSACGAASSGDDELPPSDSPSPSELAVQVPGGGIGVFDGNWVLTEAAVSGQPETEGRPLAELVVLFEVDDSTSTLVVHTNCHERSGSYTFSPDHSASISLPGSTTQTCDTTAARVWRPRRASIGISYWLGALRRQADSVRRPENRQHDRRCI